MNINKVVIKMQGHSRTDAGAAFGALGTGGARLSSATTAGLRQDKGMSSQCLSSPSPPKPPTAAIQAVLKNLGKYESNNPEGTEETREPASSLSLPVTRNTLMNSEQSSSPSPVITAESLPSFWARRTFGATFTRDHSGQNQVFKGSRSSAPLTFTPNACELCCIPKCCSCCQPWYPAWSSASPSNSLGWESPSTPQIHSWNPPNPLLESPKSTPGCCHSSAKEDGILNSSSALQIKTKGLWEEHPRQRNGQELQGAPAAALTHMCSRLLYIQRDADGQCQCQAGKRNFCSICCLLDAVKAAVAAPACVQALSSPVPTTMNHFLPEHEPSRDVLPGK
ncbi:uncharacterized protein LOC143695576 [Agelaius phoeniceus]|uniref:uncharacterized protein LOC143695576 n=1 Tax=Agelaius phoeniceus TaxID=39638 RepID=UPI0040552F34